MRKLPLYPKFPHAAVSTVEPIQQNTNCQRCDLAKTNPPGQRCMSADGTAGDVLIVSDYPIEFERNVGRPLVGPSGKFFRKLVDKIAGNRAVVYANAIGCTPPQQYDDFDKSIEACRPYMRDVLDEANPSVVLLVGNHAAQSVLGRKYSAYSVRNGYAWVKKANGENIPAFFLFDPGTAMRNPLIARALEEDLRWALSNPELTPPQHTACYELIQTAVDAEDAWNELSQTAGLISTDTETSGMMFSKNFRIEMASISNGKHTYVFDRYVYANDAEVLFWLCKILSLLQHTSWNGQYDYCAFQADPLFFPIRDPVYEYTDGLCHKDDCTSVMNLMSDARVKRKLYESDVDASLGTAAELVGMGGHKLENIELVERICDDLRKYALSFQLTDSGKKRNWKGSDFFKASDIPEEWIYYLNEGIAPEKFAHRFVPREIEQRYNALDALSTWHLEVWSDHRLRTFEDDGLQTIWNEVCQSTMWAYCRMRVNGMPISASGVGAFRLLLESEMELSLKSIHRQRPGLNPLSNPQVVQLMNDLGIKSKRKTGSGNLSASKEVLEEFKHKHGIIGEILSYRTLQKIHGTYAVGMMPWITPDDCVHPSILQSGTETGRASMADPNCFSGDTEILTECGWVRFDAYDGSTKVAQWQDGAISFVRPLENVSYYRDSEMVWLSNEHIDLLVTPDHRCLTVNRKNNISYVYPAARYPRDSKQLHAGHYDSGNNEHLGTSFIILLCATQADGHINGTGIAFAFKKKRKIDRLLTALRDLDASFTVRVDAEGVTHVYLKQSGLARRVYAFLDPHGTSAKRYGDWLLKLSRSDLLFFVKEITFWDGSHRKGNAYYSADPANADWVQIALTLCGHRATVRPYSYSYDKTKTLTHVNITHRDYSLTTNISRTSVPYVGQVYCVRVPSTYVVVRRNGKVSITGNCLNIVKGRDEETRRVASMFRNCFVAPPGHSIVEADEKQIEIRAAAEFSEDPDMVATIVSGVDFHKASAEKFAVAMGVDYSALTDEQKDLLREKSKTTNFAAVYEIPCELPFMLQARLKIDRAEAAKLGKSIFQSYTRLREWMDEMYAYSHATGAARTYWKGKFARRRPLWGLGLNPETLAELEKLLESSKGYGSQSGKYDKSDARATYNTPVQGGAVDIVASMLWRVQRWLDANTDGGKLVLHVYDSIMVVVKDADVPKTIEFLQLLMCDKLEPKQSYTSRVPLGVDIKYGRTWSTLKKYETSKA